MKLHGKCESATLKKSQIADNSILHCIPSSAVSNIYVLHQFYLEAEVTLCSARVGVDLPVLLGSVGEEISHNPCKAYLCTFPEIPWLLPTFLCTEGRERCSTTILWGHSPAVTTLNEVPVGRAGKCLH